MDANRPRPSRGRPRRKEKIRHILFKASTYDTWMKKKFDMGFNGITNSEFAEVLLHSAAMEGRETGTNDRNTGPRALSSQEQAISCSGVWSAPADLAQHSSPVEDNQDNSDACDETQLSEDDGASAPVEIELVLTKSMTNKPVASSREVVSCDRRDVQNRACTADAKIKLSRTRYITLTKEGFVHLMFRCLECSSECRLRGKGRGEDLTFRQECLICCNYRDWTSQAADIPNKKAGEDSIAVRVEHGQNVKEEELSLLMETHEDGDEEEDSNLTQISNETANRTYPESPDTLTADEPLVDDYSGEDIDEKESDQSSQNRQQKDVNVHLLSSSDETNVSAKREMYTDEAKSEEPADKVSEKRQQEHSDEYLPSSSEKVLESCDEETSKKEMTKKTSQNTIKPVIWCIDCEAVAKMSCVVQRHKNYYCCAECVSSDSVENLSLKDFSVHFSDAQGFRMHAIAEHSANLYEHKTCQDCNKTIKVETDPNKKGHVCEYKIKPFACNLCHKRFITEIGQKVHYRRLHRDYQHTCKYCMMVFDTKQFKLEHELSHKDDKLFYMCPDCPEKFKDFGTRNEHLKIHPDKKKHTCGICKRKFAELYRYERHMRIHSGEKPYKCEVCDRSFNQDGHLKSHMRLHTGEKPFLCEHCGESFNHNISLKNHWQRQHGIDCVLSEENKLIGRPIINEHRLRRKSKMYSTADAEIESCGSDEEQQKRVCKRKYRRKNKL